MSHTPQAISLPRVYSLVGDLNVLNPHESASSIAFKRAVLRVLAEYGIDCEATVRSSDGRFTGINVLAYLLTEVHWNVASVLRDWMLRYRSSGYDYVVAWAEEQSFQGC